MARASDNVLRQQGPNGAPLYFASDHLGSTVALTNASGDVVEYLHYEAFGESTGSSLTRYGFTVRERDEVTGLLNYRARWYDPQQGRFISEDPIGMAGGYNEYAYVRNDPINLTDPLGLQDQNPWQRPPDPTKDRRTYNCVGLACRTYEYQGDPEKYKNDYLSKGRKLKNCSEKCKKCEIKHWLWEYELHFTDDGGNDVSPSNGDFHTVAGQSNCRTGADPTNVYSKNGRRPVIGPGSGGSFRPPDRERATDGDDRPISMPDGSPVYKVRKKRVESCYCMPKPKK